MDTVAFSMTWKCLRELRESLELVWIVEGMRRILRSMSIPLVGRVRPRRPANSLGVRADAVLSRYQNETSFRVNCIAWMRTWDSVPTAVREGAEVEVVSISTSVMLRK